MRILCVGRNAYNIRGKKRRILCMGQKTVGMPTLTHAHFMRGKKGEKDAYYAWANRRWACPHEEIRILCVGRNAYNIRGKKGISCMGQKNVGMPTLTHVHFMRGKKCA